MPSGRQTVRSLHDSVSSWNSMAWSPWSPVQRIPIMTHQLGYSLHHTTCHQKNLGGLSRRH